MSVAGGLPRAVERGIVHGCDAMQIFAKNANQWRGRQLPPEEIRAFRRLVKESAITPVVSHASYLINLASANRGLRAQSMEAMGDELDRAEALGLDGLVMHPGSYTSGTEDGGLVLIGNALAELLTSRPGGRTKILLEHTAGQGTNLGHRFEHLARIIDLLGGSPRVGVCLDTCHLLAAGYDICSPEGYAATFKQFGKIVGFSRLKAFHLNDSKKPCASRVDRHEHIGKGCIGLAPFRRLLNDPRFARLPMLLETPKEDTPLTRKLSDVDPLDRMNLDVLRGLLQSPKTSAAKR